MNVTILRCVSTRRTRSSASAKKITPTPPTVKVGPSDVCDQKCMDEHDHCEGSGQEYICKCAEGYSHQGDGESRKCVIPLYTYKNPKRSFSVRYCKLNTLV